MAIWYRRNLRKKIFSAGLRPIWPNTRSIGFVFFCLTYLLEKVFWTASLFKFLAYCFYFCFVVSTPTAFRSGPPQYTVVTVIRGPNGFGFTIADSPYGQRVKEIIDHRRCVGLCQGDVIIRINNTVVHNLDHAEVVETLKSCPRGAGTHFQIQRSGVLTVVKSMPAPLKGKNQVPRPKSMPNFDDQVLEQPVASSVRSSSSMGVIATSGETSTVTMSTYEERMHPQVSDVTDGYKSLKRAVQSNSR